MPATVLRENINERYLAALPIAAPTAAMAAVFADAQGVAPAVALLRSSGRKRQGV